MESQTKTESYHRSQQQPDLNKKQQMVYNAICTHRNVTRNQLVELTGLRLSSVCGRVNELIAKGMVHKSGKLYDPKTDRNVETLSPFTSPQINLNLKEEQK